ncbi:MAG: glycosyltransferase [Thermoplasmatota archaeon]
MRPSQAALLLLFTSLGGAGGFVARSALLAWTGQANGLAAYTGPPLGVLAFVGLGAFLGLGFGGEFLQVAGIERAARTVIGFLAGGFAGLILYAVGYVVAQNPGAPVTSLGYLLLQAVATETYVEIFCVGMGASIGLLVVRSDWRFFGILSYVSVICLVAGYLHYSLLVSLPSVPVSELPLSIALFVAESASLLLVVVYAFYTLDVSMRRVWRRLPASVPFSRYYVPSVAFFVTVFNEPAPMVLESLQALTRIDYPASKLRIEVLDDSTDPNTSAPIRAFCEAHGFVYRHREKRRGYKAGAMNDALAALPDEFDLVSVLDADFQVEPGYLRETVGYFINPNLGFLQTPQDYRNRHQSFLTEQYYHADAYFYRAILPSRNEENTIIFCGTMGLLRRSVLKKIGGFDEACVTEDSEVSVRIFDFGYEGLYINQTYGRGLIPPLFDAYKKQLYRWSFGGAQILRKHGRRFLFGRLSLRQKIDFLVGSLHWFDGLFICTIAGILAIFATSDLLGHAVLSYHEREVWLVGLVPFALLADGIARLHLAMRRSVRISLGGTMRVVGIWLAMKFNNMFAALKAASGVRIPFVRTPKATTERIGRVAALSRSVRLTRFETTCSMILLALAGREAFVAGAGALTHSVSMARILLSFWLLYYAAVFGCAPLYAYKSFVTFKPEEEGQQSSRPDTTFAAPQPLPEGRWGSGGLTPVPAAARIEGPARRSV